MGPYGPLWAHKGPYGPIRAHMGPNPDRAPSEDRTISVKRKELVNNDISYKEKMQEKHAGHITSGNTQ